MLEAVLAIIAALVAVWAKGRVKRLDDKNSKHRQFSEDVDLAISKGNGQLLNSSLDGLLDELQHRKSGGDSSGQRSDEDAGK